MHSTRPWPVGSDLPPPCTPGGPGLGLDPVESAIDHRSRLHEVDELHEAFVEGPQKQARISPEL